MSTLRYYFDCTRQNTKELFEGLKITEQEEKYTSKLGYYPCIYITLKDVRGRNFNDMMLALKTELVEIFIEYANLLKSEKLLDIEKEMFNTVLNLKANEIQTQNALKLLSRLLNKEYDKPVILLVDEYDVPLQTAYVEEYYEEAIGFFKTFYGATFKDNQYLEKTVLTGVSRVAKESANRNDPFGVLDVAVHMPWGITNSRC